MAKIKLGSTLVMDILLLLVTQGFLEMNGYNFILCLKEVEREQLYLPSIFCQLCGEEEEEDAGRETSYFPMEPKLI